MKKLFSVLIFLLGFVLQAQEELTSYAGMVQEFKELYNNADYNAIFQRFNADMRKALPRENTLNYFAENVNKNMGSIQKVEFNRMHNGFHIYRANFDRSLADISIAMNGQNQISGFSIIPVRTTTNAVIERNSTKMILPFAEEWFVFLGGISNKNNYHAAHEDQKYAYDLLMVKNGASYEGDLKENKSYYVFGKNIIAPCDGRIVKVIKGVVDNIPGDLNPEELTGNTIVIETVNKEYILFAHLKKGSIVVEEGNDVRQGDVIGQCGNSGNSTEPHLHLSLQNAVEMDNAIGGKLYFDRILVNGEIKEDYLPVKEDIIKNIN